MNSPAAPFGSLRCLSCGHDLIRLFGPTPTLESQNDLNRWINNGLCDPCQRDRFDAAVEYERACAEARLMGQLGANPPAHRQVHPAMRQAMNRIAAAESRCVLLKMWPATRAA